MGGDNFWSNLRENERDYPWMKPVFIHGNSSRPRLPDKYSPGRVREPNAFIATFGPYSSFIKHSKLVNYYRDFYSGLDLIQSNAIM